MSINLSRVNRFYNVLIILLLSISIGLNSCKNKEEDPSISGTVYIGNRAISDVALTAVLGGELSDAVEELTYQWQTSATADGHFIAISPAATEATYTPSSARVGLFIRVSVSRSGYTGTIYSNTLIINASMIE